MGRRLQVQSVGCRIENAELKIENAGRRGRRLPVAIVLRFDRVGRREPPPTNKRNVCHIRRGWRPRHPTRTNCTNHAEQRNRQIKIILMNLLPVAHTVARPDRNEKIILILIRITAECDKHPNADLPNGTYAEICRGDPVWSPDQTNKQHKLCG